MDEWQGLIAIHVYLIVRNDWNINYAFEGIHWLLLSSLIWLNEPGKGKNEVFKYSALLINPFAPSFLTLLLSYSLLS